MKKTNGITDEPTTMNKESDYVIKYWDEYFVCRALDISEKELRKNMFKHLSSYANEIGYTLESCKWDAGYRWYGVKLRKHEDKMNVKELETRYCCNCKYSFTSYSNEPCKSCYNHDKFVSLNDDDTSDESVVTERGKLYGKFADNARLVQECEKVFKSLPHWADAPDIHKEAAHMILQKLARCFSGGSFEYDDHWVDIEGYANRVTTYIRSKGEDS